MSTEITRACDADRERYINHLNRLYAEGYIASPSEMEAMRGQVLTARSLKILDDTLAGLPRPLPPRRQGPRDWSIPRHFVPACTVAGTAGLLIGVLPATALTHQDGTLSNVLTAFCVIVGVVIVIASIAAVITCAFQWSDLPEYEQDKRRERDRR